MRMGCRDRIGGSLGYSQRRVPVVKHGSVKLGKCMWNSIVGHTHGSNVFSSHSSENPCLTLVV